MNVAALTSIRQVDEARFQLEASTIRGLTEVAKARKSSSLFVCPLGIISQLQAHVPHTYAHRAGKLGNPFSHLSASLSWPDSLFNQAQWAVESVKHTPSPHHRHNNTSPRSVASCQLPATHWPRPRDAFGGTPAHSPTAPLVIYIMTTHSCWPIVINFLKCLLCGPSGKAMEVGSEEEISLAVSKMFASLLFLFVVCCLPPVPFFRLFSRPPEGLCRCTMGGFRPI